MPADPPTLAEITDRLIAFRDARDWRRFHSLKNLILSVSLEAAELLELTQWKDEAEVDALAEEAEFRAALAEECADVRIYLLLVGERAGFDLAGAAMRKIDLNATRYPVDKARGTARKYTEL